MQRLNPIAGIQKMREDRKEKQLRKSESMEKERALRKTLSMTKDKPDDLTSLPATPNTMDSKSEQKTNAHENSTAETGNSSTPIKQDYSSSTENIKNELKKERDVEEKMGKEGMKNSTEIEKETKLKRSGLKAFGGLPSLPVGLPSLPMNPFNSNKKDKNEKRMKEKKKEKKVVKDEDETLPEFLKLNESFLSPTFDSLFHIILGIVSSWIFGLLGLSLLWVFVLFYFVARLDTRRFHRTWKKLYNQYSENRIAAKKGKRVLDSSKEGAEWINSIIEKAWPNVGEFVFKTAQEQVKNAINVQFKEKLPPQLTSLELVELDLGMSTPKISDMKTYPQISPDHYKLDFHLRYLGDISCMVVAKVKTQYVNLTIPIKLQNVHFESNLHFFLDLCNVIPFVQTINLSFSEVKLDFALKPLQSIDLMDIPFIQPLVESTVREAMQSTPIRVELGAAPSTADKTLAVAGKKKSRGMLGMGGVMAIGKALGVAKKNKSLVEKFYNSMISVKLIECKGLIAADANGKSDPYVIMETNDQTAKSIAIKKTLNPVWNTYFQFFVDDTEPKILNLDVFDQDLNSDDFLGCAHIDFSELKNDDDRKDYWVSLIDKNGRPMRTGQIHVKIAYYVGLNNRC